MELYSGPLSLFTAKVRIALAEKGLDYERIEVGWSREDRYLPHHPKVVEINPKRQVPCLVDGELAIYDSTLIVEYLEDRHPTPALMPSGAEARARCRLLELEADEVLFPHVWELIEARFYPGGDDGPTARAADGIGRFQRRLATQLAAGPYLCGDFGVADIANFVFLFTAGTLGVPVSNDLEGLGTWFERVGARPAVAREVQAMSEVALAG